MEKCCVYERKRESERVNGKLSEIIVFINII